MKAIRTSTRVRQGDWLMLTEINKERKARGLPMFPSVQALADPANCTPNSGEYLAIRFAGQYVFSPDWDGIARSINQVESDCAIHESAKPYCFLIPVPSKELALVGVTVEVGCTLSLMAADIAVREVIEWTYAGWDTVNGLLRSLELDVRQRMEQMDADEIITRLQIVRGLQQRLLETKTHTNQATAKSGREDDGLSDDELMGLMFG